MDMAKARNLLWISILMALSSLLCFRAQADGGFFVSSEAVAVSANQKAVIIQNGVSISVTLTTAYTGDGSDFCWIIPTPVPPDIQEVHETGKRGEILLRVLGESTAPVLRTIHFGSGCFPSGTEVLTSEGPRAIENVGPGLKVWSCNLSSEQWEQKLVLYRQSVIYEGEMITIEAGPVRIRATPNHSFFVVNGGGLSSRPTPRDVSMAEQSGVSLGRWVEARDLKPGDVLKQREGKGLAITGLSSRFEKSQVYCLEVEGYHNWAVLRSGILVHNKGSAEGGKSSRATAIEGVLVFARVASEHYDFSILGAATGSALLGWLQENGYRVSSEARTVLDAYVAEKWAFVAVKLNPTEKREYVNEFLPPITVTYQSSRIVFPLRISSVSTTGTVKLTLFVISAHTVSSINFPTERFSTQADEFKPGTTKPEDYVESEIKRTLGRKEQGLVVTWAGTLDDLEVEQASSGNEQRNRDLWNFDRDLFLFAKDRWVTRLEARLRPSWMTEDIQLVPHDWPPTRVILEQH
jgi:hypothetical protein